MSQLIKIILIDSLCAGAKAELVMRGNTSVNGANGIGKSSFLKLIPVFYGAAPGRLVKAGANRHSFANWYLPNSSSFIIFEYTNYDNATRCVIMHRSGEGYAYRLVAQAWQPELLYRDCAAGLLVPSGELIGHLARMGMDCSPEMQPLHYRKIIQYNTGSAHLDDVDDASKRPLIMGLRLKFSLVPRRKHFAGIDNVTLALLESGGTFDTMKVTMAEILQQENADPGRALMTLNARPFRQVLDNRASFLLMEQMQPGILHLDQLRHGFAAVTRQLGVQKWRALQLMRTLEAQQETRSAVLAALAEEEQALERTSGDRRRELATRLGKVQAELAQASQQVSSIEEQRQDYASSGIAEWLERASRHAETLLQREQKQVHLNQLNQQGLDIRQVYDQRAQTAKDAATSQREMTRVQLEGVRQAIQNRLDAQGDALNQLLEKTGGAQYVELETQQQRLHDLISQCIREDAALDHLKTMKVLPQAQTELDQAQLGINNQQILCRKLQDALAGLEDESQKLRQEQEALVADFQGVDRERAALQRQREVLKAQASAGADTLLGFLKRHHPNWTEHIARLVPADILMRTDLNPEFFTAAQQSLYGVELSLGALPLPAFACKEMGEAEIAALTEQIHELDSVLEGMQKQRRSLEEKMRQHNGKLIQARNVLSQADTELASRISLREGILSRALAAHAEQVALQKHRVEDASAHKRHMESRMAGLKKTHAIMFCYYATAANVRARPSWKSVCSSRSAPRSSWHASPSIWRLNCSGSTPTRRPGCRMPVSMIKRVAGSNVSLMNWTSRSRRSTTGALRSSVTSTGRLRFCRTCHDSAASKMVCRVTRTGWPGKPSSRSAKSSSQVRIFARAAKP